MNKEIITANGTKITFDEMTEKIKSYMDTRAGAKIIIGSDSQRTKKTFCFATAIAIIDPGNGGIFFIKKEYRQPHRNMDNVKSLIAWKVWTEAQDICEMLSRLIESGIEINEKVTHHDISKAGLSGEHLKAINGFMVSMGCNPEMKPNAVIASGLANAYSKH